MPSLRRPGCLVRSTLAFFGITFLPLAVWFGFGRRHHYWNESIGLFVTAAFFLYLAVKRDSALLAAIDDLEAPANQDA